MSQLPQPTRRNPEEWADVIDRLLRNDEAACLELSRLVARCLGRWRAYDFRDEWPDLIQETLMAVMIGAREGKIRERKAAIGYIRTIAHRKFVDRLRSHLGRAEDQTLRWDEATDGEEWQAELPEVSDELIVDVRIAVQGLPGDIRRIVFAVYGEGHTREEVAEATGIPLGTVKRRLREGLAELRDQFAGALENF